MEFCLIYMTAASADEAQLISKTLLERRLVAGTNIIEGVNSSYWWKGKIEPSTEVSIIAQSRQTLVPDIIKAVKSRSSYECPCVIAMPLVGGNPDFLKWIERETEKQ